MRYVGFLLLLLGLMLGIFSCKKTDSNYTVDAKYEYFPNDSGRYTIYDADSVVFNNFTHTVDTVHFQLMELTQSIFKDNSGRPTMRIERYRRADSTQAWAIWDVWTANLTATTAERFEDNLRFIKLAFPLAIAQPWPGNSYIIDSNDLAWLKDWQYQITALDVPATVNAINFDSTLTVLQDSDQNLIEYKYGQEVYAKHVGLVYKQLLHLKKNVNAVFPSGAYDGFIYTLRVHSYGHQ